MNELVEQFSQFDDPLPARARQRRGAGGGAHRQALMGKPSELPLINPDHATR